MVDLMLKQGKKKKKATK